jgi:hypothetical protein
VKRLLFGSILVLWLAVPAVASAANWNGTPSCAATTTTLTCSGKVVGLKNQLPAFGELSAQVMWKCEGAELFTSTSSGEAQIVPISKRQTFTISWTPPAVPPEQPSGCATGTWIRWDPNIQQPGIVYDLVTLFVFQPPASKMLTYQFGEVYPS